MDDVESAGMGPAYLSRLGIPMPTLDERVAYLEGRLEEHSSTVDTLRSDIQEFRRQFENRIDGVYSRMDRLDSRMDALDARVSRQFTWLVGIQIVMFIALMSAIGRLTTSG